MVQVKLGVLQCYNMFRYKDFFMNGTISIYVSSFRIFPQNLFLVINYSRRVRVLMRSGIDSSRSQISNSKFREAKIF